MNDRSKKYIFISYNHYSKTDLGDFLKWLEENDFNAAYDSTFGYGEDWRMNALSDIENENCVGTVVLISRNSICSEPVNAEIMYTSAANKPYFGFMVDNCSFVELKKLIVNNLTDTQKYWVEVCHKYFNNDSLVCKREDLEKGSDSQLKMTLNKWGLSPQKSLSDSLVALKPYSSALEGESDRLSKQSRGYYEFDKSIIDGVLKCCQSGEKLVVLDLGCADGEVTFSRFENEKIEKVIGVDRVKEDIDKATKKAVDEAKDKFSFIRLDLEDDDFVVQLKDELKKLGITNIDIVFSALTFHHLEPEKGKALLRGLSKVIGKGGYIIIRSSDDGGKMCYPLSDEMDDFLRRYSKLTKTRNGSDRFNARKLYEMLKKTGYENMKMHYKIKDTCGMNLIKRQAFYNIGFSFRKNRLNEILAECERQSGCEEIKKEAEDLLRILKDIEDKFYEDSFWYSNTSYAMVAQTAK